MANNFAQYKKVQRQNGISWYPEENLKQTTAEWIRSSLLFYFSLCWIIAVNGFHRLPV